MSYENKVSEDSSMYIVYEDLDRASGPKVHSENCFYYERWKNNPITTTTWHGPYDTKNEAWKVCEKIARRTGMKPSRASCC